MKFWYWLLFLGSLVGLVFFLFAVTDLTQKPKPLFGSLGGLPALPQRAPGKVVVWAYGGVKEQEAWEERVKVFERATGQAVALHLFEKEGVYRQLLEQAWKEGKLPDVFLLDARDGEKWWQREVLASVDLPEAVKDEWAEPVVHAFEKEGRLWAYPSDFSTLVLFYNRAAFDRLGIGYPDDHWSWSIAVGIAQALYQPPEEEGVLPFYGIEMPLGLEFWNVLSAQQGQGLYEAEHWQVDPKGEVRAQRESLRFLLNFFFTYAVVAPPKDKGVGELFLQKQSALLVAGAEMLPFLSQAKDFNWGVTVLPKDIERASSLKAEGWAICAKNEGRPVAVELAFFLASSVRRAGWLPARLEASLALSKFEAVFYQQLEQAQLPWRDVYFREKEAFIFQVMQQAIDRGSLEPEGLLLQVDERFRKKEQAFQQQEGSDGKKTP